VRDLLLPSCSRSTRASVENWGFRLNTVYLNGKYLHPDEALISPEDRAFLFGDGLYEVVRVYNGRIFSARDHMERLHHGGRELDLHIPLSDSDFESIVENLLDANDLTDAMVYLQVSRGSQPREHCFPAEYEPTVYANARPASRYPKETVEDGVRAITHPDIRGGLCYVKTTALLFNCLAATRARRAGAYEALLVRQGFVTEATARSAFCVIDGTIYTHPLANILPGITRKKVLELACRHGWEHQERALPVHRFVNADEIFVTGTVSEIVPVVEVDGCQVGDGRPGPVFRRVYDAFQDLIQEQCG